MLINADAVYKILQTPIYVLGLNFNIYVYILSVGSKVKILVWKIKSIVSGNLVKYCKIIDSWEQIPVTIPIRYAYRNGFFSFQKLDQITKLKEQLSNGIELEKNQLEKISKEDELRHELETLML